MCAQGALYHKMRRLFKRVCSNQMQYFLMVSTLVIGMRLLCVRIESQALIQFLAFNEVRRVRQRVRHLITIAAVSIPNVSALCSGGQK